MSNKELLADVKAQIAKVEKHIETGHPQLELLLRKVSAHLHFVTDGLDPEPVAATAEADTEIADEAEVAAPDDTESAGDAAAEDAPVEAPKKAAAKRPARKRA